MPAPKGHPPYNKNGEGGKPKKYTEDFLDNEARALLEWMEKSENIFIERFCYERGFSEDLVADFSRENERFRRAYSKLKTKQKFSLFEGGLKKKYAHPMCALILSHNHGIYAKTEQKISGSATDPLAFVIQDIDGSTKDLVITNE